MKPKLSIVIPVKGVQVLTYNCLRDIKRSTDPEVLPYEVVIFDSPSEERFDPRHYVGPGFVRGDDLPLIVEYSQDPNIGMYELLNRAVEHTRGDYLAIINNDLTIGNKCFEHLLEAMQLYSRESVYPSVLTNPGPLPPDWYELAQQRSEQPTQIVGPPEWRGWFIVVSRRVWEKVGGFDEHYFMNYGYNDFFETLRRAGFPSGQVSNAVVHHYQGQTNRPDWYENPGLRNGAAETKYFREKWGFEVYEQGRLGSTS